MTGWGRVKVTKSDPMSDGPAWSTWPLRSSCSTAPSKTAAPSSSLLKRFLGAMLRMWTAGCWMSSGSGDTPENAFFNQFNQLNDMWESKANFQIDAFTSASDWLIFRKTAIWLTKSAIWLALIRKPFWVTHGQKKLLEKLKLENVTNLTHVTISVIFAYIYM